MESLPSANVFIITRVEAGNKWKIFKRGNGYADFETKKKTLSQKKKTTNN